MDKAAQSTGIENPDTQPVANVPMSKEEKRVNFILLGGLLLAGSIAVGLSFMAVMWALEPIREGGTGTEARLLGAIAFLCVLLAIPVLGMIGRWPGTVSLRREIEIAATPDRIWERLAWRDGMEDWKGIYRKIERLPDAIETYCLHMYSEGPCGECGLPKHPDTPGVSQRVEVLETAAPFRYRTRSYPSGTDPTMGDVSKWLDIEENLYIIERTAAARSKVALEVSAQRPKLWMAAMLWLGGPAQQSLATLKANLEGAADDTIYSTGRARIAAARLAPRHCGCPA